MAALAWSASDSSTSGQTTKHWRPGGDLLADPLVGALARPGAVHHEGLHRPAPGGQLAQHGRVEVAVGGQREGARDRRGGHVQRVRREPVRGLGVQRGALAHAEAVLLVHDAHGQVAELHGLLDQGVRAHHELERARAERAEQVAAPGGRRGAR